MNFCRQVDMTADPQARRPTVLVPGLPPTSVYRQKEARAICPAWLSKELWGALSSSAFPVVFLGLPFQSYCFSASR